MSKTHYLWDFENDSYLMEKDGTGATTAVYTNEPVRYGKLISQRRGSATSYYHFDGQHSTRHLTDQNQNVTDEFVFSAFGETVARSGTTANPFGFIGASGYYADGNTSTLFVRRRTLSYLLGMWMSRDPFLDLAFLQSTNLYAYCRSNPIGNIDPSGLFANIIAAPCGTFHWTRHDLGDRPGWDLDFDPKGCNCKGRVKLVQIIFTWYRTTPHFDCKSPKKGGRQLPKGTQFPGYCDSGFGEDHKPPASHFPPICVIWDAPEGDTYEITACAVCEVTNMDGSITEAPLSCINFIQSKGKFNLEKPNTPGPLDPGPTKVPGGQPNDKMWEKAKKQWENDKDIYFPM